MSIESTLFDKKIFIFIKYTPKSGVIINIYSRLKRCFYPKSPKNSAADDTMFRRQRRCAIILSSDSML